MNYGNGDLYKGLFHNNRKKGNGIMEYANGDLYEGMFN